MTTPTSTPTPAIPTHPASLPSLGQVGYEAYGDKAGPHGPWRTFDGRDMPRWIDYATSETGALTRERWESGVAAAIAEHERRMAVGPPSRQQLHLVLASTLTLARAAQDKLGRGVGGQELAHCLTKLREAEMWLDASLKAEPSSLAAPSNLAHKG